MHNHSKYFKVPGINLDKHMQDIMEKNFKEGHNVLPDFK